MAKCYFELRKQSARGTDSIAADMMRHLHARQHLGKAVIICDQPISLLAACRKQWLKLTRVIQKQRASTLNADKILKYTHTITHMQHMRFSAKSPAEDPEADIYFVSPSHNAVLAVHCFTVYATEPLSHESAANFIAQLPADALVVDYQHSHAWAQYGLQSKTVLEAQVQQEWSKINEFLKSNNIDTAQLSHGTVQDIEAMDDALDRLLDISQQFLRIANEFHRTLELARPLRTGRNQRLEYDAVMLLAYRVQALSPGIFTQHFLEIYNEDDTFFLYDAAKKRFIAQTETLEEALTRHKAAGRPRLAKAMHYLFSR